MKCNSISIKELDKGDILITFDNNVGLNIDTTKEVVISSQQALFVIGCLADMIKLSN